MKTEVIRPDEEPVLKTGGGLAPLVGSSPTASAQQCESKCGPVVQRLRLLAYTQATMVRFRPGLLARVRQSEERLGSGTDAQRWSPRGCRFDSGPEHMNGSVGNWQTTLA